MPGSRKGKRTSDELQTCVEEIVLTAVLDTLNLRWTDVSANQSFLSYGGNSISAMEVHNKCREEGVLLSMETLLSSDCLEKCYRKACFCPSLNNHRERSRCWCGFGGSTIVVPVSTSTSSAKETEMQQIFCSENGENPGTNIIRFCQTFETRHIPALIVAWKATLEVEEILNQDTAEWETITCSTTEELAKICSSNPKYSTIKSKHITVSSKDKPEHTTIIWDVHHALIDGYSMRLLYSRVRALTEGKQNVSSRTPFTQVARNLKHLQKQRAAIHKSYWQEQISQHPMCQGRLNIETTATSQNIGTLTTSLTRNDLPAWCQIRNVTLAALHYAAWSLVLSIYCDSDSVVFGAVVSGRSLPIIGVNDTIGPLVNTLPFYINVDWSRNGEEHVRQVFQKLLKLHEMESSSTKDGFSRNFDSALAMEVEIPSFEGGIQPVGTSSFSIQSGIPVSITFDCKGKVKFHYQPHLLHDVELMQAIYDQWLSALMASSQSLEHDLSSISKQCFGNTLLRIGNLGLQSTLFSSMNEDLVTRFEGIAINHPYAIALRRNGQTLSYEQLDIRAGRLAFALQKRIKPGDVVFVHADRSFDWLIGTFAVLKLGGVYAPVNLALPLDMRAVNYRTAKAVLYLVPSLSHSSSAPAGASVVGVEEAMESALTCIHHRVVAQPEAPAYLCFTSGSTGKPKAVLCRHGGLAAFQSDPIVRLQARVGRNIAQVMSPAFDGSIHEIFSALCFGATLLLPSSPNDLSNLKESDSAILTPSLARSLDPREYARLRQVYLVGEPVPPSVRDAWVRCAQVFNMYGPTESTCGATIKQLRANEAITIGCPNPSSRVYVLDRSLRPCPPNVIGDIYTAGIQVAVGYLELPELTAQRFSRDPFCPNERMYYTGDRGCWTHSGEVRCLGRSDRQVKLNGFRLDLNLIEEQIVEEIPQVEAVGLVKKDDYLVAAVIPASLNASQIKKQLANRLPLYSLPQHIYPMACLPKTAIGKIDYPAIGALEPSRRALEKRESWGVTERLIERTWREILNLDAKAKLYPRSTMLELGGDSLAQVKLSNRLSKLLGHHVSLQKVIQASTICDLALAIDQSRDENKRRLMSTIETSISRLEAEWIRRYQVSEGTTAFNVTIAWSIDAAEIDHERLASAWNAVLEGNEIFSSYYVQRSGEWCRARHQLPPKVERVNSFDFNDALDRPFQLEHDYLVRVLVSSSKMLVVISHILCDLTTLRIILNDVAALYADPSTQVVQRGIGKTSGEHNISQEDLSYWSEMIDVEFALQNLTNTPQRRSFQGSSQARWLPRPLMSQIAEFSREYKFTFHQLALAAVAIALQHGNQEIDITLGAPFINRNSEEQDEVGLFLEPLPIRVHYRNEENGGTYDFLQTVREASQNALLHHVPWHQLLESVGISYTPPDNPIFDVMVTFHDLRRELFLPIVGLQQLHSWSAGSKFKLMVELSAFKDEDLLLRLEYDSCCFSERTIDRIFALMVYILTNLPSNVSITELKRGMASETSYDANRVTVGSPTYRA